MMRISNFFVKKPIKNLFTTIYEKKGWGNFGTLSGPGSTLEQTEVIRKTIPNIIQQYNISSFLDAPCGDFFWMKNIDFKDCSYIGVDIVDSMIKNNNELFGTKSKKFIVADIIKNPLPYADLIFCRDCLVHLSFNDCLQVINNFKESGARYLLTTTFVELKTNKETKSPLWRPLNLQQPPFNFPDPVLLINEQCTHDSLYPDKSLGLWDLNAI